MFGKLFLQKPRKCVLFTVLKKKIKNGNLQVVLADTTKHMSVTSVFFK